MMNPILIFGMVAVGIALFTSFISISNDQFSQADAATKISEKQHARIVEAVSLKATVTNNGNIAVENLGNVNAKILEIRVLDNDGKVIFKKALDQPIYPSKTTEIITTNIKTYIKNIRSANT